MWNFVLEDITNSYTRIGKDHRSISESKHIFLIFLAIIGMVHIPVEQNQCIIRALLLVGGSRRDYFPVYHSFCKNLVFSIERWKPVSFIFAEEIPSLLRFVFWDISVFFIIFKTRCPSMDDWIVKMWCVCTLD